MKIVPQKRKTKLSLLENLIMPGTFVHKFITKKEQSYEET